MGFKLTGWPSLKARIKAFRQGMPEQVDAALYHEAQIEMTEAKRRTPVWNPARKVPKGHTPGSLRASGMVHEPEHSWRKVTVTLSFGNEIVDYAIYVHEDLEAFHASGQAKFLESVLMESAPYIMERVGARIHLESA